MATGEELYLHASRVLQKMKREPEKNIPNTAIVYAWNEHDEGGWCCPTIKVDETGAPLFDETGRQLINTTFLDAIKKAIEKNK